MAQINLTWIEKQRFLGVDSSAHSVVLSPANDVGVKPSDTLLISLAACSAYDVVEIIHKQRAHLSKLTLQVTGEQAGDPPWPYRSIHLHYTIGGTGLREEQVTRAVDLSLNKYCSVRASLHPDIAVTFEVTLLPE